MSAAEDRWAVANEDALRAAIARVRAALLHAVPEAGDPSGDEPREPAADRLPTDRVGEGPPGEQPLPALDCLVRLFELSPFERDVLVLCAAVEVDPSVGALCARALGEAEASQPTMGLALGALSGAHWSALAPTAPLRRWRLIDLSGSPRLTASSLRIDERILHYLLGVGCLDERLDPFLELVTVRSDLGPSPTRLAERVLKTWRRSGRASACPVTQLTGNDARGKRDIAAQACVRERLDLFAVNAGDLPALASDRDALVRLWEREAILRRAALYIDCEQDATPLDEQHVTAFIERSRALLFVGRREALRLPRRACVDIRVDRPGVEEQRALWIEALGNGVDQANGVIEQVVAQFDFGADAIRSAAADVSALAEGHGGMPDELIWQACRLQVRPKLDRLAHRIVPVAGWDDLVLPDPQIGILRTISAHVRRRDRVYQGWGFARTSQRGLGISALFTGPSGTGKTMAAEVLANDLNLDLYRIDLSALVSKYIGETEKNLSRVFDAAEEAGSILLFDEADALFGKRSEVRDSHDRYANIEVSYLLQRIEVFRGLAILTSNLRNVVDPAFLRRIRFITPFPFPDEEQRAEIWRHVFPREAPTDELDFLRLARLNLPGGGIRNLALNAAFLAADRDEPVRMRHVADAARVEYAKLEKPVPAEIGCWS